MTGKSWCWVFLLAVLLSGCAARSVTGPPGAWGVEDLVPRVSSLRGWTAAEKLTVYTPDNLFEYIDGAAPQYLSYGFRRLAHVRYAYRGDDLSSVTLDVYDMGRPLGAYGIYTSGRPRDLSPRHWGVEGYRSGTVAAAWKEHVYVHAVADDDRAELVEMMDRLVGEVCASIPGTFSKPPLVSALPITGLIPYTDRFIGKDLLGHSFLPGGFLANYSLDGSESLLFLSDLGTEGAARRALNLWRRYEEENGKILEEETGIALEEGFWAEDPGLGLGVVTVRGEYLLGIWGVPSKEAGWEIVSALRANLEDHRFYQRIAR